MPRGDIDRARELHDWTLLERPATTETAKCEGGCGEWLTNEEYEYHLSKRRGCWALCDNCRECLCIDCRDAVADKPKGRCEACQEANKAALDAITVEVAHILASPLLGGDLEQVKRAAWLRRSCS